MDATHPRRNSQASISMAIDPYLLAATAACIVVHFLLRRMLRGQCLPLPPGPRGVPVLGALPLLGTHAHVNLARLARRYGPIMFIRLGSHGCVVASNAAAARAFLKTHDLQFADRPNPISGRDITFDRQNLVLADYTPKWKLLRRACSLHFLGGRALADSAPVRRDEMARMVRALRAQAAKGEPVTLPDVMVCALANIIGMVVMSKRVFDSHGVESNRFKSLVFEMLSGGLQFNIGDFFPWIAWMDLQGIQARMKRVRAGLDVMLTKLFEEHEAMKEQRLREGRLDFLDKLIASKDMEEEGETITDINIRALFMDLFVAGSDTSAIIVEWAMSELLRNPSLLRRAQAEADSVVGRDRLLEESDLPRMPFLQAICKEALRLHPSTPLALPHFCYEASEVGGYYIPPNSRLLVNVWAIGRDPSVWANPLVFDPDRFMGEKAVKYEPMGNDFEFIPFGAGRRICAGKMLGMVFLQYMLGTLVHSFDWRLPDGVHDIDMEEKHGLTLPKLVPLKAVLTSRLSPVAYNAAVH